MENPQKPNSPPGEIDLKSYVDGAEKFLQEILPLTRLHLNYQVKAGSRSQGELETHEYVIHFEGTDGDLLLENQAELLAALEYLTLKAARVPAKVSHRIGFDCQDWRFLRVRELKLTAEAAAERVRQTGVRFVFNPMRARERRIIHLALKEDRSVRTASEGQFDERKVVIYPSSASS
jgi:spoIIIJ-associated protein